MRTIIALLAILGMSAVQAQNFAPTEGSALSGVPLTVAKRTNLPTEPSSAALASYVAISGVPMTVAKRTNLPTEPASAAMALTGPTARCDRLARRNLPIQRRAGRDLRMPDEEVKPQPEICARQGADSK